MQSDEKLLKTGQETIKIGIIVGAGTGLRLTEVFKMFMQAMVGQYANKNIEFLEDLKEDRTPYIYHSYQSLVDFAGNDSEVFDTESKKEVERLHALAKRWHEAGVNVIFRTSINAEALYQFRQEVKAVKIFGIETPVGSRILFIRDQAEGFYANQSYTIGSEESSIQFQGVYTKQHQQQVAKFALREAHKFMGDAPYQKWAIYKHHLFANLIEKWMHSVDQTFISYQPDNGITNLINLISKGHNGHLEYSNVLCVCSNEVGDMVYEAMIGAINIEPMFELYSRNIYLSEVFSGNLTEYQTVHGSADDLVDMEKLIPYATLRIAGDILAQYFDLPFLKSGLERAIAESKRLQNGTFSEIIHTTFVHFKLETRI